MLNGRSARKIAILEARELVSSNFCVLDTETTGLGDDAEIVEISILDSNCAELFTSFVRPSKHIPPEAQAISGITNEMVQHAPSWSDIYDGVMHILAPRRIAIYNMAYDLRLIRQTCLASECWLPVLDRQSKCVMDIYSKFMGEWDNKRGWWKRHKLSSAAQACGVGAQGAHRAIADCRMTLGVIKYIAGQKA
jgi:DNA polymerase III epsilon subunit-like protein